MTGLAQYSRQPWHHKGAVVLHCGTRLGRIVLAVGPLGPSSGRVSLVSVEELGVNEKIGFVEVTILLVVVH